MVMVVSGVQAVQAENCVGGQAKPVGSVTFDGKVMVGEKVAVERLVHMAGGQVKPDGIVKPLGSDTEVPVGGQVKFDGNEKFAGSVREAVALAQGVVKVIVVAVTGGQVKFAGREKLAGTWRGTVQVPTVMVVEVKLRVCVVSVVGVY